MLLYYGNFIAKIEYISRVSCFYGEVINYPENLIVFLAEHQNDLAIAFKTAVEQFLDYINYSNIITIPIPPQNEVVI